MELKEFQDKLSTEVKNLKEDMASKSKEEISNAISGLETKMTDIMAETHKKSEEAIAEQKAKAEELQKAMDSLAAKMNAKKDNSRNERVSLESDIKRLIDENLEGKADGVMDMSVKGKKFGMNVKAVADMTLTNNLTGDQPRDYDLSVKMVPGRALHFGDLVETISIAGGTYTFPRETGGEGSIAAQTEGSDKSQKDYDLTMVDVTTDFLAGFAVYSRKMANNLPFLETFLPNALRRDYMNAEDGKFNTILTAGATASTQIITGQNKVEMLLQELATLEAANEVANGIVMKPADWYDIMITEKSTGAGYGLPGIVTFDGGVLRLNGIPVFKANWMADDAYYVGDWSVVKKILTEGLSLAFSDSDASNFRQNKITARIEEQNGLAIHRPAGIILGDFTAV